MAVRDSEEELKQLRHSYDNDLKHSAVAFQQLQEENERLSCQLERVIKENSATMEVMEQERYVLQMKLSLNAKMEESYKDEIEGLRVSMTRQLETALEKMHADHTVKVETLNRKIGSLHSDLEQCQLSETQLMKEKEQLESLVKRLQDDLEAQTNVESETLSEEFASLSSELNSLKRDKVRMTKELIDAQSRTQDLEGAVMKLKLQLQHSLDETEEKQCQATSYYNAIEHLREEILELRMELDLARMEANTMKKNGNSLFAEVEDRRIEAEKKLIAMKVQNDSLKKQLEIVKHDLSCVKMQMAALLQLSSIHADKNHLEHLNAQLSQATGEVRFLTLKLTESEGREKALRDELLKLKDGSGGETDYYVQYLRTLLQRKEREMTELQKELQTQRLMALAESQNLIRCERRLYATEQQLDAFKARSIEQLLKIEELKQKYEPDSDVAGIVRKVHTEKLPWYSSPEKTTQKADDKVKNSLQADAFDKVSAKENDSLTQKKNDKPKTPLQADAGDAVVAKENILPISSLTTPAETSSKTDNPRPASAGMSVENDLLYSDKPENDSRSQLKSILIPPGGRNPSNSDVQTRSCVVPRKVTMSDNVLQIGEVTDKVEEKGMGDFDSVGVVRKPRARQKQSRVIHVSAESEFTLPDNCKTQ